MSNEKEIRKPSVHIEWNDMNSAELQVRVENVSPAQIWAAVQMLQHFADDMYRMQTTPQPSNKPDIAIVRTLDHLRKGN